MPYETTADRLREDLADELFSCYVYVGDQNDDGWEIAKFAYRFKTQINLYLFEDHSHLGEWVGRKRPRALVFGWKDDLVTTLDKSKSENLLEVMRAMDASQRSSAPGGSN